MYFTVKFFVDLQETDFLTIALFKEVTSFVGVICRYGFHAGVSQVQQQTGTRVFTPVPTHHRVQGNLHENHFLPPANEVWER